MWSNRVLNEPLRALAPTFGVDVPVVVKWAVRALSVRSLRDRALAAVLAAQLFFVAVIILWWSWAWTLFLLMILVAWLIVAWDHHERINRVVIGKMLHDTFSPDDAPRPGREDERRRIDEVAGRREGNLVVFSGHDMFVGSGEPMYRRHLLLDVIWRRGLTQTATVRSQPRLQAMTSKPRSPAHLIVGMAWARALTISGFTSAFSSTGCISRKTGIFCRIRCGRRLRRSTRRSCVRRLSVPRRKRGRTSAWKCRGWRGGSWW